MDFFFKILHILNCVLAGNFRIHRLKTLRTNLLKQAMKSLQGMARDWGLWLGSESGFGLGWMSGTRARTGMGSQSMFLFFKAIFRIKLCGKGPCFFHFNSKRICIAMTARRPFQKIFKLKLTKVFLALRFLVSWGYLLFTIWHFRFGTQTQPH